MTPRSQNFRFSKATFYTSNIFFRATVDVLCSPLKGFLLAVPLKAPRYQRRFRSRRNRKEFENTLTCSSGAMMGSHHEKIEVKISWHTPFNLKIRYTIGQFLVYKGQSHCGISTRSPAKIIVQYGYTFPLKFSNQTTIKIVIKKIKFICRLLNKMTFFISISRLFSTELEDRKRCSLTFLF